MHSFRQSRTRILFEVFCALAISASCVGAWMQTGASALLSAAAVSALYGLVHAFDMVGRRTAVAVEPQRIDFATDDEGDLLAYKGAGEPAAVAERQPDTDKGIEQAELVEAPLRNVIRRVKAPRKGGGRRVNAPKEEGVTELAPLEEAKIASIRPEVAEPDLPIAPEEVVQPHIEALFEPDPFVRMPRRAFGRKGG